MSGATPDVSDATVKAKNDTTSSVFVTKDGDAATDPIVSRVSLPSFLAL
jgi:hypothetical protein